MSKSKETIKKQLVTTITKNNHAQKIVSLEEAKKMMLEDRESVVLLPNPKIVLRFPT